MIELRAELGDLDELRRLPKQAQRGFVRGMDQSLMVLEGEIRKSIKEWLQRSNSGLSTGRLMQSFKREVLTRKDHTVVGVVGSDLPYAAIHEFGGTITPKKSSALTIPMKREARRRGARSFPELFVYKTNGKAFLARRKGESLEVLYFLAKRVEIQPKGYLARAEKRALPKMGEVMGKRLTLAFGGRSG